MRNHLKNCILNQQFTLSSIMVHHNNYQPKFYFISNPIMLFVHAATKYTFTVIYHCKLPLEYPNDAIRCLNCKQHFHKRCVDMENGINAVGCTWQTVRQVVFWLVIIEDHRQESIENCSGLVVYVRKIDRFSVEILRFGCIFSI